ncbi:hypothetical protein MMC17_000544 [Xylographa soralifera]|nr:hypothetical protein [Xylographa soralifera]
MAAHFDAFRTGDPFAKTIKFRPRCGHPSKRVTAAYHGGLLAWRDREESAFTTNLLCLRTSRTKRWADQGRHKVRHIAVSELLVAVCSSSGNISIYNQLTDDKYTFKLSSGKVRGFALRSTTLAILLDGEINVWNLTTQTTRQISLVSDSMKSINCSSAAQETFGLHFAANEPDFICFHAFMNATCSGKVVFVRVPLDGSSQETSTEHEISPSCLSTGGETCQMIPGDFHTFGTIVCNGQAILIGYDESRNQPQFHGLGRSNWDLLPNGYYQKHVLYQTQEVGFSNMSRISSRKVLVKDLHGHRDQHNTAWKTTNMDGSVDASLPDQFSAAHKVLGDETFLVHMYPTHIMAYCFDQNSEGGYSWTKLRPSPVSLKK